LFCNPAIDILRAYRAAKRALSVPPAVVDSVFEDDTPEPACIIGLDLSLVSVFF